MSDCRQILKDKSSRNENWNQHKPKGVSVSSDPAVQGSLTRRSGPSILKDRKPGSETGVKFGAVSFYQNIKIRFKSTLKPRRTFPNIFVLNDITKIRSFFWTVAWREARGGHLCWGQCSRVFTEQHLRNMSVKRPQQVTSCIHLGDLSRCFCSVVCVCVWFSASWPTFSTSPHSETKI